VSGLREVLAERTRLLCEIKSPLGEEADIARHVADAGSKAWFGQIDRIGNSVVMGGLTGSRPGIVLFGHLDTVPIQEGDFPARREGGRVYGRGASDMKGALAVMLTLGEQLDRSRLRGELVLVFYDREEGPYETNGLGPVLAARPDLRGAAVAFCLEPTDLAVQAGCCGSMHATFTFRGRTAHSARPWQGKNAVHEAGGLLAALRGLAPIEVRVGELTFREVMNVTRIEGFNGRNVLPARCDLNVNFRFAPGKTVAQAEAELRALAERFGAECEIVDRAPAGDPILDNALLKTFRELTSVAVEPKQAWTDVARLGLAGIPAANFGPGEQAEAHQRNESCSEEALERGYLLLERFLTEVS
jgi:succinyl-diaminopimelate desuccinylase